MQSTTLQLDFQRQVVAPLTRLGRRLKLYVLVQGLCHCAALLVGCAAVAMLLDRMLVLGLGPRAAILAIIVGLLGRALYQRVLRPATIQINVNDVAALLERVHPESKDQLLSAVAFATGAGANPDFDSPAMISQLIEQSTRRFQNVSTRQVLRRDRHYRYLALGLLAIATSSSAIIAAPDTVAVFVKRDFLLRDTPWPMSTRLILENFADGKLRWPIGDELTLVARALDKAPQGLRAEFELDSGDSALRDMDQRGDNQFVLDYGPLAQPMRVRLLIGKWGVDESTEWYTIEAVRRPSIQRVAIRITPPAYAGLEPFSVPDGQASADILRGSTVRIIATAAKSVVSAALKWRGDDQSVADAAILPGDQISSEWMPQRDGTYYFDLLDADGLRDLHPVTYSMRLLADPPPRVKLTLPGCGEMVVPSAVPTLAVTCEDNLGMQSVALVYQVAGTVASGASAASVKITESLPDFVTRQTSYSKQREWPLLPLTLKPGDRLTLQVRATDYQPVVASESISSTAAKNQNNMGESTAYTLRVVTAEELLAELGRRENEWRREFEQIIKSQEQLKKRLADAPEATPASAMSAEWVTRYSQEARTQRQQGKRIKTVARQFAQILDELKVNQLATPAVRRRLEGGVLGPLRELADTDMIAAADLMDGLREQFDAGGLQQLEQAQTQIIRRMYEVLANMLKWEGYNEAVVLLRDILQLQSDVNKETQNRMEGEIEKLFGPQPTTRPGSRP